MQPMDMASADGLTELRDERFPAMTKRPTDSQRLKRSSRLAAVALCAAVLAASGARPASAQSGEDGSALETGAATAVDALLVRPLAAVRAAFGAALFVPAAVLVTPGCVGNAIRGDSCRPIYEAPYDVLIGEPVNFAFEREMGDL